MRFGVPSETANGPVSYGQSARRRRMCGETRYLLVPMRSPTGLPLPVGRRRAQRHSAEIHTTVFHREGGKR